MDVNRLIAELSRLDAELELEPIERRRFTHDLERVLERLQRREYQKSGFGGNRFDIPSRANELLVELEFYGGVGRAWTALLERAGLGSDVVDLCPGWGPKIELALHYAGYTGRLLVVDKDRAAIDHLLKFTGVFAPQYAIDARAIDIFSARAEPQPIVAANHVIDDLLVDRFLTASQAADRDVYAREDRLAEVWSAIAQRGSNELELDTAALAEAFAAWTSPGGKLIITQYPSYIERLLSLKSAVEISSRVMDGVADRLVLGGWTRDLETPRALEGRPFFGPEHCRVLIKPREVRG